MKDLPSFRPRPLEAVQDFIAEVLTNPHVAPETCLRELIPFKAGHSRALFAPAYFVLSPGTGAPSKSQWSGLKKKLKRHNPAVFVFKECGSIRNRAGEACLYIDFGFFAD